MMPSLFLLFRCIKRIGQRLPQAQPIQRFSSTDLRDFSLNSGTVEPSGPHAPSMMTSCRLHTASITLCLLLSNPSSSSAQHSAHACRPLWNVISRDVKHSLGDASAFYTAPLRFDKEEWFYTAGFLAGGALLLTSDEAGRRNLSVGGRASSNGDFRDIPTAYGSAYFACGLTLATYATGIMTENEELRITGRLLGESLILSGMPTLLIKSAAGRSRPCTGEASWRFRGIQWDNGFQSFPSGHAMVAFALSTVLAERSDNIWARVGLYGLASLTALARVRDKQHWFSDVVVGAGLGLAAGLHVIAREEQRPSYITDRRVILYPSSRGLTVAYRIN